MYMDGVACYGSESKITDCPSLCWEEIKCNHTQDAGVVCHDGTNNVMASINNNTPQFPRMLTHVLGKNIGVRSVPVVTKAINC